MLNAARAAATDSVPAGPGLYLRRIHGSRPRSKRSAPILLALAVITALLLARVWQVTGAHALSMERDRLRHEVHALENRIRLSSDLSVREALREGLDYEALAKQGFASPDPTVLVDIDLDQPFPRVVPRQGAMARLTADVGRLVRGILPAKRVAPGGGVQALPVSADVVP